MSSSIPEKRSKDAKEFEERVKTLVVRFDRMVASSITGAAKSKSARDVDTAKSLDDCLLKLKIWLENFNTMIPDAYISETLRILSILFPSTISGFGKILLDIEKGLDRQSVSLSGPSGTMRHFDDDVSATRYIRDSVNQLLKLQQELVKEVERSPGRIKSIREEQKEHVKSRGTLVLCLDGGGVRSTSSLLILRSLMDEIEAVLRESKASVNLNTKAPHEVFRYIFGSSSGGVVAIMLGRLKMTSVQAQETFQRFAMELFRHPRRSYKLHRGLYSSTKYSEKSIINATEEVVGSFDPNPGGMRYKRDRFAAPGEQCKCGVFSNREKTGAHLLRSYETLSDESGAKIREPAYSYQIWEAARATTAAPTYFPPAVINGDKFLDGGISTNNPSVLSLNEVISREPDGNICLVSIGSGRRPFEPSYPTSSLRSLVRLLRDVATDTEEAHRIVSHFAASSNRISYFRFDAAQYSRDIALDDWTAIDEIKAHTYRYLRGAEARESLRRCALAIIESHSPAPSHAPIKESRSLKLVNAPARNTGFCGREPILEQMSNHLLPKPLGEGSSCVLYGPPGIGKTQIALEYIYRQSNMYSSIFWINAESRIRLSEGLYSMARAIGIRTGDDAMVERVREWLSSTDTTWLLVFDEVGSADAVMSLIPENTHGAIIITSRNRQVKIPRSLMIPVEPLKPLEGARLLKTLCEDNDSMDAAIKMSEMLTGHPVDIAQAASYIKSSGISIGDYMRLAKQSLAM
ncbi:hypothetical protein AYL99_06260 [Fonsecaea erecta]|uniref:PNPLA domain-containing protein n=1 Tax=Fonsecaea erecta TaxID=1367422 RepID=A0A178ZID0_9EURO|nr:hypothetical protein AYL99_06260 [Fonsecaea erecta]OAP58963.1 hypothetical protein AYL99_06260 [Fonsecaea erecta]